MGYINTTPSKTAFDVLDVSLLSKINLINLFASYRGKPRLFEIEAIAGMGWLHYYVNGKGDDNSWSTRLGLNLNFNLGETKAWTLGIKPAIVYDMQGDFNQAKSRFNANNATFELTAGLTYHFKMSTGNHYFTKVKVYNQSEIDDLNVAINALREQVGSRDRELNNANQRISGLHKELEECRTKVVPIETVVKTAVKKNGNAPIIARITIDQVVAQFNTKLEINPAHWSVKLGKASGRTAEAVHINSMLESIHSTVPQQD